MYINKLKCSFWLLVGAFSVALSGCTALSSHPATAKVGDTVTLSLGSADGMSRANTTAVFISDSDPYTEYDLTPGIRGIFNLYADKASGLYTRGGSNTKFVVDTSGHEPWATVMVVDVPDVPIGIGKVHVTTSASYPTIGSHINDVPINLEILPGQGSPSSFTYEFGVGASLDGDMTLLEALPHAQITPEFPESSTWPAFGAIEMSLHVPTSAGTALDTPSLRVVADDFSVASNSVRSVMSKHDSNQDLTVIFLSPSGKLRYFEPRFSIVLKDPIVFSAPPVINSVSYYDVDGNEIGGPLVSSYTVQMR